MAKYIQLFISPQKTEETKWSKILLVGILLLGVLRILLFRRPDAIANPQFWSEDGFTFFADAFQDPLLSVFKPYAGYLNLWPRLVATLAQLTVDATRIPAFYMVFNFGLLMFASFYVFYRFPAAFWQRFLAAAALVMLPVANQVYLTLCCSQFFGGLLILIPLLNVPNKLWQRRMDATIILLFGLTGPFSCIFLPVLFISKWLRDKRGWINFGQWHLNEKLFLGVGIIQLFVLVSFPFNRNTASDLSPWNWVTGLLIFIYKQFVQLLHIPYIINDYSAKVISIILLAVLLIILFFMYIGYRQHQIKQNSVMLILLTTLFAMYIALVFALKGTIGTLHPVWWGERYFYIPSVLICWLAVLTIPPKAAVLGTLPIIWLVWHPGTLLNSTTFPDYHWQEQAVKLKQEVRPIIIPVNPGDNKIIIGK